MFATGSRCWVCECQVQLSVWHVLDLQPEAAWAWRSKDVVDLASTSTTLHYVSFVASQNCRSEASVAHNEIIREDSVEFQST